jgi:hypothetical protein
LWCGVDYRQAHSAYMRARNYGHSRLRAEMWDAIQGGMDRWPS